MAEEKKSNVNVLSDVILPTFAFLSAASGPRGAVAAQALTQALSIGQRRRQGDREEKRLDQFAAQKQQEEAQKQQQEAPIRDLARRQAEFQGQNLGDIQKLIGQETPAADAQAALGPETTARLQDALGRGEQVPLPTVPATPEDRQARLQKLATAPGGAAQLTAAGLGDVAKAASAPDQEARMAHEKFVGVQKQVLDDVRGYTDDVLPPEQRQAITQGILTARSPDDLVQIAARLPASAIKPQTARVEEYKFYADQAKQQGQQPLGFLEFQTAQRKASATKIQTINNLGPNGEDYGDPPKGHAWARDEKGKIQNVPHGGGAYAPVAIPIKGSLEYREIQDAIEKKQISQAQSRQAAGIVTDTIGRAVDLIDTSVLPSTGLIGSLLGKVPGTDAHTLATQLDTIRANIGFEALQKIRSASPTGGALGAVSDLENRLLQSVLGSIRPGMASGELKQNLLRIREIYNDILYGVERPDRKLEYLTQSDIADLQKAQADSIAKQRAFYGREQTPGAPAAPAEATRDSQAAPAFVIKGIREKGQ